MELKRRGSGENWECSNRRGTGENIRSNYDFHETPVAFELSMNSRNNKKRPKVVESCSHKM